MQEKRCENIGANRVRHSGSEISTKREESTQALTVDESELN